MAEPQKQIIAAPQDVPVDTTTAIIQVIERAAANPNIDVDKMERLLAMQERILDRNAKGDFAAAMARVQAALPQVVRKSTNAQTNSKYAKHEQMAKAIKPVYTSEGFSIEFSEGETAKENHVRIVGVLRHQSGHEITRHVDLPLDLAGIRGNENKTRLHATGSTFSYGRRYLTLLLFDVATGDDDDGQGAQPIKKITDSQAADLKALAEEVSADVPKFLEYLSKTGKVHITKLSDIPAVMHREAVLQLERRRAMPKKQAQEAKP